MNNNHTFAILAHKESSYLQDCIDSLKNQTSKSSLILCASTPSEFLREISSKNSLPLCINPQKKGIASDWNFALGRAETKYVTLAHQDDIYHENYSKEILEAMEKYADALLSFSDYEELICEEGGKISIRKKSLNFTIKKILNLLGFLFSESMEKNKTRLLFLGNPIGCPAVTFHKENIGDFQFDPDFSVNLDWDAWYRLAQKKGKFLWIRKPLVAHRIHPESETSQGLRENRRQSEDFQIFKRIWPTPIAKILGKIYALSYGNNN